MNLTTVERVKRALPIDADNVDEDTKLAEVIEAVSIRMERFMGRETSLQERTQQFEVDPGLKMISVPASPITAVAYVKTSSSMDFTEADELTENTDFVVNKRIGLIRLIGDFDHFRSSSGFPLAPIFAEVKWTGGWTTDADKLAALQGDIVEAATLQVCHLWKRRSTPGANLQVKGGSEMQFAEKEYDLLREVRNVCLSYQRRKM